MRAAFILFIAIADALRIGPSIAARASSVATGARSQQPPWLQLPTQMDRQPQDV